MKATMAVFALTTIKLGTTSGMEQTIKEERTSAQSAAVGFARNLAADLISS